MGSDFKIADIPVTVADGWDEINTRNSLIICDFVPFGLYRMAPILNAATGLNPYSGIIERSGSKNNKFSPQI